MAEHLTLRRVTNRDKAFYPLMGPFLSRRAIVKEIGAPIWDDDNKTWYVALDGRNVAGFAAVRDDGDKGVTFQSAYTLPEHRRRGVYRFLLTARLRDHQGRACRSVATAASLPVLLAHGFEVHRVKGSFTEVVRHAG